jgi:hypothetical protein
MTQPHDPRTILAGLRPQPFGKASPNDVLDPIVEPHWAGMRVLGAVDADGAVLVDEEGQPVEGHQRIVVALAATARADGLVVDGYLTKQVLRDEGTWTGPAALSLPSASTVVTRLMIGSRRNPAHERAKELEAAEKARQFEPDDPVTMIVTDLLWLEGESLLDVPLLERRRLLDSVVGVSDVVRIGAFVRPPIHTWVGSWRGQGFTGMTFKAANSRYSPGVPTKEWALTSLPRR